MGSFGTITLGILSVGWLVMTIISIINCTIINKYKKNSISLYFAVVSVTLSIFCLATYGFDIFRIYGSNVEDVPFDFPTPFHGRLILCLVLIILSVSSWTGFRISRSDEFVNDTSISSSEKSLVKWGNFIIGLFCTFGLVEIFINPNNGLGIHVVAAGKKAKNYFSSKTKQKEAEKEAEKQKEAEKEKQQQPQQHYEDFRF